MGKESCGSLVEDLVDAQSHIIDSPGEIDAMYALKDHSALVALPVTYSKKHL